MPRFAANLSWLFQEHAFLDRFAAAADAGFRAVEFRSPYENTADEIASRLERHQLQCILFNLPMGDSARGDFGIACRPGREDEFRQGVARAIEYAKALRTPQVNCIVGTIREGEDRALLERTLVANLRHAADALATAGVGMVIEPINSRDTPAFLMPTAGEGARIIEAVGHPNLGLQCDLYHTAMMGEDPARTLRAQWPIVRHIQFADVPGRGEPGTGTVPITQLFETIDALGYQGWVSAEYRPSKPTAQTLHWMSRAF